MGSFLIRRGMLTLMLFFSMMKNFHEFPEIDKLYLISGDGDYYKTVKYLLSKGKFGKILFPSREKASSLYRQIGGAFFDFLDSPDIQKKIKLVK